TRCVQSGSPTLRLGSGQGLENRETWGTPIVTMRTLTNAALSSRPDVGHPPASSPCRSSGIRDCSMPQPRSARTGKLPVVATEFHWPDIDQDLSTEGLLRGAPGPRTSVPAK